MLILNACAAETKTVINEPGSINEVSDADGDGYNAEEDCNDNQAAVNPGAEELCDGLDNNCDGTVDEDVSTPFYADLDNDGFGNEGQNQYACEAQMDLLPTVLTAMTAMPMSTLQRKKRATTSMMTAMVKSTMGSVKCTI